MSKKRILLVGDGNHQFITNYVYWIRKVTSNDLIIDILSFSKLKKENSKTYNTVYQINEDNALFAVISKIKGIRRFYRFHLYRKLIDKLPFYDIVHFHFISVDSYYIVNQLNKNTKSKIILSIWGSDMYRLSSVNAIDFVETCQKADILTFTNQKSIDYFKKKYDWKKNNLNLCRFGLAPLEKLKQLTLSREECKKLLKWNDKKRAITIGYNLSPGQQHLEILSHFDHEKIKSLKDKIQLILPITYGGTPQYKKQLLERLSELDIEHKTYDTFLTDEQVAQIRKASDIMIQLQKTDQFSGSMQEHLYSQNIVITGNWLPYETMKEYGAWFIEIDKLEELNKVVLSVINNFEKYEHKTNNNPQAVTELSSWERNIQDWIDLYSN